MRGSGAKPPENLLRPRPSDSRKTWETPFLAFLIYLENFGKAALSSSIFRNSGHFCTNENRIVKYNTI